MAEDVLHGVVEQVRADLGLAEQRFVHFGGHITPKGWRGYEDLISGASAAEPALSVAPDDPWCLFYTSGTTGNPKGAIRGHRGMSMLWLMTQVELGLGRRDNTLLVIRM